jgi:hypothetical protein
MRAVVLKHGAMSEEDFDLVTLTDDPEEAAEMATRPLPVEIDGAREPIDEAKAEAT